MRATALPLAILLPVLVAAAGCGGGPATGHDAIYPVDPGVADPGPRDGVADDADAPADAADVPPTDPGGPCEQLVAGIPWLCLGDDRCRAAGEWLACLGVQAGVAWGGACNDVTPGACEPSTGGAVCGSGGEDAPPACEDGTGCAHRVEVADGLFLGTCRGLPAGGCWSDDDCPENASYCAGAALCPPDADCAFAPFPGRCVAKPPGPGCWDDAMCGDGRYCDGVTWCAFGDTVCTDAPGNCSEGPRPACGDGEACQNDSKEDKQFCIGATAAGNDGWCAPAPASLGGDCWDDGPCGESGESCLGARPCPPGTVCGALHAHPGVCGATPAPGRGLSVTLSSPENRVYDRAVIVNGGPVPIYLVRCMTLLIQFQFGGAWPADPTQFDAALSDATCAPEPADTDTQSLLRLAPGETRVLEGLEAFTSPGQVARPILGYLVGCTPGATDEQCREESEYQEIIGPEATYP
jgi:hypothetical protein